MVQRGYFQNRFLSADGTSNTCLGGCHCSYYLESELPVKTFEIRSDLISVGEARRLGLPRRFIDVVGLLCFPSVSASWNSNVFVENQVP